MSTAGHAVFLSYASQDAEAARKICEALRAAGVEVWFDQSELVGGDAWDAKIRKQIKECALFVPVISAATQARREGYFRIEWKLAAQRTHAFADGTPFLLPVVIDATRDAEALVPEEFRAVQWTRVLNGETTDSFTARVKALAEGSDAGSSTQSTASKANSAPQREASRWFGFDRALVTWAVRFAVLAVVAAVAVWRPWHEGKLPAPSSVSVPAVTSLSETQQLIAKIAAIVEKDADASREEWTLAENLGAQAVKLEPANPNAWAAYANAAFGLFQDQMTTAPLERALQRAQQAVALAPELIEPSLILARSFMQRDQTRAEAEPLINALLGRNPNDRRVLRATAALRRMQGRHDDALALYDRAARVPGGDPLALREKATLLVGLGRYREGEAALDESMALRAGPAALVLKLELLVIVHDDLPQACTLLEKMPGSYLLREEIAQRAADIWLWKRDYARCLTVLHGWSGNYLNRTPKGFLIGKVHQLAGRPDAARLAWRGCLATLDKAIEGGVAEADIMYWKTRLLGCLGENTAAEAARRTWEQALAGSNPGKVNRAQLLMDLGQREEAIAALPQTFWSGLGPSAATVNRLATGRATVRYDPIFDPLRGDPRFEAIVVESRRGFEVTASPKAPAAQAILKK